MARVPTVAVLSMKGGVGKTTVVLGLASAAAHRGKRVLVIDLDPQGNATMGLAVEEPAFTIGDVLADARPGIAQQAIETSPWGENVHVLAADRSLEHRNRPEGPNSEQRLRIALASLPDNYDLVLIDCPPSLGEMARNALHAATAAVIVTEPSYFALHGAEQAKEAVELVQRESNPGLREFTILVNKARTPVAEHRFRIAELNEAYGEHVSAVMIPERQAIAQAEGAGIPIHSWESPAGTELAALFDTLVDDYFPKRPTFNWGFLR
jgi:chromosome partitioning protein